jgi:hypothetical protein
MTALNAPSERLAVVLSNSSAIAFSARSCSAKRQLAGLGFAPRQLPKRQLIALGIIPSAGLPQCFLGRNGPQWGLNRQRADSTSGGRGKIVGCAVRASAAVSYRVGRALEVIG